MAPHLSIFFTLSSFPFVFHPHTPPSPFSSCTPPSIHTAPHPHSQPFPCHSIAAPTPPPTLGEKRRNHNISNPARPRPLSTPSLSKCSPYLDAHTHFFSASIPSCTADFDSSELSIWLPPPSHLHTHNSSEVTTTLSDSPKAFLDTHLPFIQLDQHPSISFLFSRSPIPNIFRATSTQHTLRTTLKNGTQDWSFDTEMFRHPLLQWRRMPHRNVCPTFILLCEIPCFTSIPSIQDVSCLFRPSLLAKPPNPGNKHGLRGVSISFSFTVPTSFFEWHLISRQPSRSSSISSDGQTRPHIPCCSRTLPSFSPSLLHSSPPPLIPSTQFSPVSQQQPILHPSSSSHSSSSPPCISKSHSKTEPNSLFHRALTAPFLPPITHQSDLLHSL